MKKKAFEAMIGKVFFDGHNRFCREALAGIGFDYFNIGQKEDLWKEF